MRRTSRWVACAGAAIVMGVTIQAQSPWVHVRVNEAGTEGHVAVNMPLSAVEAVVRAAPERFVENGRLRLHDQETGLSISDLRTIWSELSAAGDTDLVTAEKDGHTVRVARRGDRIEVRVTGRDDDDGAEVVVDVPTRVIDALLSGDEDELNIESALQELRAIRGDVVNIRREEDRVRVWIDEAAS